MSEAFYGEIQSNDFARFMTPEGTKTLILAFSSKMGQPVEYTRHKIFLFGFFCLREDKRHFIGVISDSKPKGYWR